MKYQWRKFVSTGPTTSKLVKVEGLIGHVEFNTEKEAENALYDYGCQHDRMIDNWVLNSISVRV